MEHLEQQYIKKNYEPLTHILVASNKGRVALNMLFQQFEHSKNVFFMYFLNLLDLIVPIGYFKVKLIFGFNSPIVVT